MERLRSLLASLQGRWISLVIGAGFLATLFVIGACAWFTVEGWWPTVVDIVLAFAALGTLLISLALVAAVFFLVLTLREFKSEVLPVLDSLKTTTSTVKETAKTAKTFGVGPAVRTASVLVGAGEVAAIVLGKGKANKRAERRQRRRMEIERELAAEGEAHGS